MLAAVAVFSVMDASMKRLTLAYPPAEVSALRGLASIPVLLGVVGWLGIWRQLLPHRWSPHLARGVLAVGTLSLFVYSLRTLLLSEAYAIFLCAPLIVTALSALLLQEAVGWHRWLAIAVGLGGVLIMLNPTPAHLISVGAAAALGSAVCYSLGAITIRKLAHEESTLSIAFSCVVAVGVSNGLVALPHWIGLHASHWLWIGIIGISGALGQFLMIQAFRSAPPSIIAPFEYTALLWGLLLDWLFLHQLPGQRVLIGGAIVSASGLYVIYREHLRAVGGRRNLPAGDLPVRAARARSDPTAPQRRDPQAARGRATGARGPGGSNEHLH
jgi:drug/metabolite transporter (DMT)-like permease